MTDDEMQALREVEGCGLEEMDGTPDFDALRHDRAAQWYGCDACLRLLADAVVRQRVERIPAAPGSPHGTVVMVSGLPVYRSSVLVALTGENAGPTPTEGARP